MGNDKNGLIYIYCITSEKPLITSLWHKEGIFSFEVDTLYVTMKYVSESDYSEINIKKNLSNEAWLDRNVRKHLQVIGDIMQKHTVIPLNFGTLYNSEESLMDFVSSYRNDFLDVLHHLRNKEEWSVKVFCNKDKIIENIGVFSQNISDIDLQIKQSAPGKAYILKKKKNDLIGTEINALYNNLSLLVFNRLNEFPEEYRLHAILHGELSGHNDDMIINVTFLIKKENFDKFITIADKLIIEYENIGLILDITGPWPPYSFIKLSN